MLVRVQQQKAVLKMMLALAIHLHYDQIKCELNITKMLGATIQSLSSTPLTQRLH